MSEPATNASCAAEAAARTMRPIDVVLANPYVWPHVRRGSERFVNDLGAYLAARGHRVSVVASAPAAGDENRGGVRYRLLRARCSGGPRQLNGLHAYAWQVKAAMRDIRCDVAFCLTYFDAFAMLRARATSRRFPVVFYVAGIPTRRYFRAVPLDAWFMRSAAREADAVLTASTFAAANLLAEFGCRSEVLPPPVDTDHFVAGATAPRLQPDAGKPILLFCGDADEARKGAGALCEAFPLVKARHPDATLLLSGRAGAPTREALLAVVPAAMRASIRFLGVGSVEALPALYASADLTVLPAVWEALGLVLIESLASGTPVVAARHGGIPDIVDSPAVGALFDPRPFDRVTRNVRGLADAILAALSVPRNAATSEACRARARRFGWDALGPRYEALLTSLATAEGAR